MKKFFHKFQELGKKAAEIKQIVESAPAKAAALREAVTMTAGELQQLRADVQSNLSGLRANSEERILEVMREITERSAIFRQAGYELAGMDLDLALNQKLAVHLEKTEDVPQATRRSLLSAEIRPAIKSILAGVIKAEETAANVDLVDLAYQGLIVHVGANPVIRLCWRSEAVAEEPPTVLVSQQPSAPPLSSSPAMGSFFEQRPVYSALASSSPPAPPPASPPVDPTPATPSVAAHAHSEKPGEAAGSPWSRQSLDRFKKMPDLSKYGH